MTGPTTVACNACGGSLRIRFPEVVDPQSRETFRIDTCTACGLGHTSPQPEELSRYYGPAYYGGRHGFTTRYCMWRRTRFVEKAVGDARGRLLDVGCGDGAFMESARELGFEVLGTEMNPALARAAGLDVVETLEEAAHRAPFRVITLWHSLEHMRDPRGVIQKLRKLLTPGGTLLIAVPNAEGVQAKLFGRKWFHLDVPRHLFHFGPRSLAALLEAAGLRVTRRWNQELELDLFGWTQSALNSVLPDPNVFFYKLTGRSTPAGRAQVAASFVLGSALTAVAMPAVPASTILSRGGTLVVAATPV